MKHVALLFFLVLCLSGCMKVPHMNAFPQHNQSTQIKADYPFTGLSEEELMNKIKETVNFQNVAEVPQESTPIEDLTRKFEPKG